ncbi:MAG: hypothetical protein ACW96N_02100 [Candidatus Thorarchaeota archaeon]
MNGIVSETGFDNVVRDPNFLMIVLGAIVWFLGSYAPFIGPFLVVGGFVLTIFATASTAAVRPTTGAWPGLLIGSLLYLIGLYLPWILLGFLSPFFLIPGAVLVLFFAIPLALQYGNAPLMTTMQEEWESRSQKKSSESQEMGESTSDSENQ